MKVYQDVNRLFKRGEIVNLCKQAMADKGPMDTRELSHHVMRAKGFAENNELRKAIAFRIVQALRLQRKRGKVKSVGKRGNALVWTMN